jgi:uncharacterized membrane protein YeaQ/YmgE (transglycosylase-associated protein family)
MEPDCALEFYLLKPTNKPVAASTRIRCAISSQSLGFQSPYYGCVKLARVSFDYGQRIIPVCRRRRRLCFGSSDEYLKDHAMINVFVWLLFGGLAGWMASRLTRTTHDGVPLLQIIAGGMGALVGGVVFLIFDTTPLNVFSVRGLAVALIGAMIVIGVAYMLVRRPI